MNLGSNNPTPREPRRNRARNEHVLQSAKLRDTLVVSQKLGSNHKAQESLAKLKIRKPVTDLDR